MKIEQTVSFIKPEAVSIGRFLKGSLRQVGEIRIEKIVIMTKEMIDAVYPNLPPILYEATCEHLLNKEIIVMLMEGELVTDRVVDLVGHYTDPMLCSGSSLRRWCVNILPNKLPQLLRDGNTLYFRNYIHRAKTRLEVVAQVKALLGITLEEH